MALCFFNSALIALSRTDLGTCDSPAGKGESQTGEERFPMTTVLLERQHCYTLCKSAVINRDSLDVMLRPSVFQCMIITGY